MSISACYDWFSFTHQGTNDPDMIIRDFLQLDVGLFESRGYGVRGYRECKHYDNITVYYNGRVGTQHENGHGQEFMGVYVCLSGNALRQYAKLGGDIESLMMRTYADDEINITRLDIAADDEAGLLDIDKMFRYCTANQIRSHTRNRDLYSTRKGKVAPAQTIYVGSRSSEQFVRIYDKAKEQYDVNKEPEKYNSHWIRVEMVLRRERARAAVCAIMDALASGRTVGQCLAEFLNGFMQFIENDDSNISRCSVADWWTAFVDTLVAVKLFKSRDIAHVMERKIMWIFDTLSPLLDTVAESIGETQLLRIIKAGRGRRKREYDKMFETYAREEDKKSMPDLLGYRYRQALPEIDYIDWSEKESSIWDYEPPEYRILRHNKSWDELISAHAQ